MSARPVLVLGGTAEGRELATALVARDRRVISSLAGRVTSPRLPPGEVRIGGFGGAEGLRRYLREHAIAAVVDATHPFAARITANAVSACAAEDVPLVVLRRPGWEPEPDDRWLRVPDLAAVPATLDLLAGRDGRVLLTIGRQGLGAFARCPQWFWIRAVAAPESPLPARCEVLLDRGPFTVDGERALLRRLAADVLVTKNSGGPMTAAKLRAARELGVPVVMVERPPLPPGVHVVHSLETAIAYLA